jgi:transmembrane sensor
MTEADGPNAELTVLDREAHAWVRRLTSGEATAADADEVERWCARSTAHAAAFAEATRLWTAFGPAARRLRELGTPELTGRGPAPVPHVRQSLVHRRMILGGALAASAAAVTVMVRPPLDLWPSLFELMADYRTATGEQRRIAIARGVVIAMNTQTSVAVRAPADGADHVELLAGEAAVTLDATAAPLVLIAAAARASVSNARFDVRLNGRTGSITCLAGQVRVACGERAVTIAERQRLSYDDRGIGQIVGIDPDLASAWQDGLMIFRDAPLIEVVRELNRYRPGRIVLLNDELGRNPVNGRFRIDRTDDVLAQIRLAFGAKLTTLPGGVVLLS